jgi:hypothetical protein
MLFILALLHTLVTPSESSLPARFISDRICLSLLLLALVLSPHTMLAAWSRWNPTT